MQPLNLSEFPNIVVSNNKIPLFLPAEATNLFLRTNGHEVLDAMMPQLRARIAEVFLGIANTILKHVPVSYLVTD